MSHAEFKANEPKLRHEFVGMMFAVTVGEIGLQVAALVQAKHVLHYLPAYSHLFLATFVVAASWVGWSRSAMPGARKDVEEIFEWAFVVLLLDMAMVVMYFILVRTVDFEGDCRRVDPAWVVARWHVWIFALYLLWDLVTKVLMYERHVGMGWWKGWWHLDLAQREKRNEGLRRIVPTSICLGISIYLLFAFTPAANERLLTADFALLSVVLLFRALKGWEGAISWNEKIVKKPRKHLRFRVLWGVACLLCFVLGTWGTLTSRSWPHVGFGVVHAIRTPIPGQTRDCST